MGDHEYNGWTNQETSAVAGWILGSRGLDRHYKAKAQECYETAVHTPSFTRRENAISEMASTLEADLGNVNWIEIAEHYISGTDEKRQ
jgi:hypothetical protein